MRQLTTFLLSHNTMRVKQKRFADGQSVPDRLITRLITGDRTALTFDATLRSDGTTTNECRQA